MNPVRRETNSDAGKRNTETIGEPIKRANIKTYFKQLKFRLRAGLFIAFLLPLAALSVYFHFQFHFTLKDTGKLNLAAISESQRNTVDLFLQERVVNILSLYYSAKFTLSPSANEMHSYLQDLRQVSDAFIDVGFLNPGGIQIGYAGPFPHLQDRDYSRENWFLSLLEQERNHFISDIYLGFRNKAHFTIAVKQVIDDRVYVARSTLDPDKFYMFLRTISHGKGVDSALINQSGIYQVVDPTRGELFGLSDFIPSRTKASGVKEISSDSGSVLVAYAWLKEAPWALIVREPLHIAYAQLYKARKVMLGGTLLIVIIIFVIIWSATDKLMSKAQDNAEKREDLQYQLLHASKLASIGELATGIAHEINNPLAIIIATSGVIRDLLNPEFKLDASPDRITRELDTIDAAILRARGITRQLLDYGRKTPPRLIACNVNRLLDEVTGGVKESEFKVSNIKINRNYDPHLPDILVDPDQLQQVFLNMINNAGDAIQGPGAVTISTAHDEKTIRVTITDSGRGMDFEEIKKIFDPFYTTKEAGKGTGLGLSVSMSIVKAMGGSIDVQSMPGAGSSFTISLPIYITEGVENGT